MIAETKSLFDIVYHTATLYGDNGQWGDPCHGWDDVLENVVIAGWKDGEHISGVVLDEGMSTELTLDRDGDAWIPLVLEDDDGTVRPITDDDDPDDIIFANAEWSTPKFKNRVN